MATFKVIVAGGRDFNNFRMMKAYLDIILKNVTDEIVIVSGRAKGADTFGELYAEENGYRVDEYPVSKEEWEMYGKSAGFRRNKQMALNANALVAFWDGESRGTKNMIDLALKHGLQVRIIRYKMRGNLCVQDDSSIN